MTVFAMGIDGGGSRTRAVAINAQGEILGRCWEGCGNFQRLGAEGLIALVERLREKLGVAGQKPEGLCLALAGAGRSAEQEAIEGLALLRHWGKNVKAISDAQGALEGAHGGSAGLVVIAGTGSMVLGKNKEGALARAGGWGPVLGDEGSGYALGLEGIRAVLRSRDGWGERTCLERELLRGAGLEDWDQIIAKVYGNGWERKDIAALCPLVCRAARQGDRVAKGVVEAGGRALGAQVVAVARGLGLTGAIAAAGVGGVLENQLDLLWPPLAEYARDCGVAVRQRKPLLSPVMGAVAIAWRLADPRVDRRRIQGLVEGKAAS